MTEPTGTATPETGTEGAQEPQFTPIESQEDLDKLIGKRLQQQKAQFADYGELKKAADRLAEIEKANQTEAERLNADLTRWQTEAETWRGQAVGSRIQALAADVFADPSDAVEALASGSYLDAGGQINDEQIRADLDALLERKPHWARPADAGAPVTPRTPAPNPHQGSGGGTPANSPAEQFAALVRQQLG